MMRIKTAKVWHLRCVMCGALRFGAEQVFCSVDCRWNGKYAMHIPPEFLREEEYARMRSRTMTKAVRDWGINGVRPRSARKT